MSQVNSVPPFVAANSDDLLNALGITQFTSETNWYQTIGGLIIQGGLISNANTGDTITLNASFTKQILGVFIVSIRNTVMSYCVDTVTVDDFVVIHDGGTPEDFYWFALGV